MKYEVRYTRTVTKIVDCDIHHKISGVAEENRPIGFEVDDWAWIQDEAHLNQVLAEVKAQELLS